MKDNFSLWSGLFCVSPKDLTNVDEINLFEFATSRTGTVNRIPIYCILKRFCELLIL
jgi:hypothetical protein